MLFRSLGGEAQAIPGPLQRFPQGGAADAAAAAGVAAAQLGSRTCHGAPWATEGTPA